MAHTRKVLLSGDVNGKLSTLFNRVAAVNKSNGPFDLLLCTGAFFPEAEGGEESSEVLPPDFEEYLSGKKAVPVSTYFVGGFGRGPDRGLAALEESEADLHYLGRAGVTSIKGLSIAFLDGTFDAEAYKRQASGAEASSSCRHYTEGDVKELETAAGATDGDIDILLACEWPAGITALCPPGSVPEKLDKSGSQPMANLATKVRPRYHVSGGKGVFFARVPYQNKDLGAGSHVTRFIGLGAVGNTSKQKSLHALGLVPATYMDTQTLQQKPAGTTPSPYALPKKRALQDDGGAGGQDWRWQQDKRSKHAAPLPGRPGVIKDNRKTIYVKGLPFAAEEADIEGFFSACGKVVDVRRGTNSEGKLQGFGFVQFDTEEAVERACQMEDTTLMGRELYINASTAPAASQPTGPVADCWFCLSSSTADVGLVASIGEETYIALDKGPINDHHVLILPIEHCASSLQLSTAAYAELERYLSALRTCFASKGMELLAFERFMSFRKTGGNHLQFNVVSIPAAAAKRSCEHILAAGKQQGLQLQLLEGPVKGEGARAALRQAVGEGEYFMVVLPDGSRLLHSIGGQRFPIAFGREIAAALAGVPERADWKNCKVTGEEEEQRTAAFKALFKPYDIMS